jgi:hypothetical protein
MRVLRTGQGKARHRKYKRLEFDGDETYDLQVTMQHMIDMICFARL